MLGIVGWVGSVTLSPSNSWALRFLPPAALFFAGTLLTFWALRSATGPRRELVDRLTEDGHTIIRYSDDTSKVVGWISWEKEAFAGIKEWFGLRTANEFGSAGVEIEAGFEYSDARLAAQIAFLERLRDRR